MVLLSLVPSLGKDTAGLCREWVVYSLHVCFYTLSPGKSPWVGSTPCHLWSPALGNEGDNVGTRKLPPKAGSLHGMCQTRDRRGRGELPTSMSLDISVFVLAQDRTSFQMQQRNLGETCVSMQTGTGCKLKHSNICRTDPMLRLAHSGNLLQGLKQILIPWSWPPLELSWTCPAWSMHVPSAEHHRRHTPSSSTCPSFPFKRVIKIGACILSMMHPLPGMVLSWAGTILILTCWLFCFWTTRWSGQCRELKGIKPDNKRLKPLSPGQLPHLTPT